VQERQSLQRMKQQENIVVLWVAQETCQVLGPYQQVSSRIRTRVNLFMMVPQRQVSSKQTSQWW
jgi:hypothetical protein